MSMYTRENGLCIITVYNQDKEIGEVLDKLVHYFSIKQSIVINDGSADNSLKIIKQKGYDVISHATNQGVGAAIRTGIKFGIDNNYRWIFLCSSNGKTRPEDIEILIEPLLSGAADYVTGSRFLNGFRSPGLPLFRRLSIPLFSIFSAILLGKYFSDITCGIRAYSLDLFKYHRLNIDQAWLNKYEMEYYIHWHACKNKSIRIVEVPVVVPYCHLESKRISKIKPLIGWWSMIRPFLFLFFRIKK